MYSDEVKYDFLEFRIHNNTETGLKRLACEKPSMDLTFNSNIFTCAFAPSGFITTMFGFTGLLPGFTITNFGGFN